jgi:hypothetical protein
MNALVLSELDASARTEKSRAAVGAPVTSWYFVAILGAAFAILGAVDLGLAWFPLVFGNPQWEFGTVTQTLDGLPVFTLGLGLSLGAAVARGKWLPARLISVLLLVLAFVIVLMVILYATDIPIALRAVPDPAVRQGLIKAIMKTTAQAVVYPAAFTWMGIKGWQVSASNKERQ